MRNDGVLVRERMGHEVVVCHLEERAHGGGFVLLARGPGADRLKGRKHLRGRLEEEARAPLPGPVRQLVGTGLYFVANFFDTKDAPCAFAWMSQSQNAGQKSRP